MRKNEGKSSKISNSCKEGASHGKRILLKALGVAMLFNSLSYVAMRAHWYASGEVAAELQVVREVGDSGVVNFLIAGNVNQPERAFAFMMDELDGGIVYVNYQEAKGCSMRRIVEQTIEYAKQYNDCRVRFIGISMGDYVSRFAEAQLPNAESYAINPEPHPSILKPYAENGLKVVTPLIEAATVPLGWLSHVKCIRGFSLAFLADQWRDIAYCSDAPNTTMRTLGVICSEHDEFLQNNKIEEYFDGIQVVYVDCNHGVTENYPEKFLAAWRELTQKD